MMTTRRVKALLLAIFLSPSTSFTSVTWASGAVFIKDINTTLDVSQPHNFFVHSGTLYFIANDGIHGRELWKSDGTVDGTVLLKDIHKGSMSGFASDSDIEFIVFGGFIYFSASDGINGTGLWRTDGTEMGTELIKTFNVDPDSNENGLVREFTSANSRLFFVARQDNTGIELWITDGTSQGTKLYRDIRKGLFGSDPDELLVIGDTLYFEAEDSIHQDELWRMELSELCLAITAENDNVVNLCL